MLLEAIFAAGLTTEVTVRVFQLFLVLPRGATRVALAGAFIHLFRKRLGHEEDSVVLVENVGPLSNGESLTSFQQQVNLTVWCVVHELTADATSSRLLVFLLQFFDVLSC